jgi:hypothetical protein
MPMLPPVFMELRAGIGEFRAKMGEAAHEVEKLERRGSSSFSKLQAIGKGALLGIGAAAGTIGVASLHLADTFEKSHAQLENAVRNSGASMERFRGPIAAADATMERFGFTNAETEDGLARLTTGTGSARKAIVDISLAANIARARHLELGDAASLVAKAAAGQARALRSFGISNVDSILKIKDPAQRSAAVLALLNSKFAGAAQANASTFAGKMEALHAKVSDLGKGIGLLLIPVIEKAATVTLQVVQWFERHRAVAIALGAVVGGMLLAAIGAYVGGMIAAAAASVATAASAVAAGIAMAIAFWPVTLAVLALVAVGFFLYRNWHVVWSGIQTAVRVAWSVLKPIGEALVLLFFWPIILAAKLLADHWRGVWGAMSAVARATWHGVLEPVFHAIVATVRFLGGVFGTVFGAIGRVIAATFRAIEPVIAGPMNLIIGALNLLIRGVNAFAKAMHFKVPSFVPGLGGKEFGINLHIPEIPYLESGGFVPGRGPILSMLHGGELVLSRAMLAGRAPTPIPLAAGGGSPVTLVVPVQVDGREIARITLPYTQSELVRLKQRNAATGVA